MATQSASIHIFVAPAARTLARIFTMINFVQQSSTSHLCHEMQGKYYLMPGLESGLGIWTGIWTQVYNFIVPRHTVYINWSSSDTQVQI